MSPRFPDPQFVDTNGIRMAIYEEGAGFPVVFSHGFPELAYSWRYQLPAVAAAGFRAIAPDQRGYGQTSRPDEVDQYSLKRLTGDLAGLLDALGLERAVFCGHDWGGMVVWSMAQRYPERTAGVIGVNTPFIPRGPSAPLENLRAMAGENHYVVHFQKPGDADRRLAADVRRVFERLMRKGIRPEDIAGRELRNMAEHVEAEESPLGTALLDPEELDVFVRSFERTGFTGGINWYRNIDRNWGESAELPQKLELPALMISAEHDFALPPALADGMEVHVPGLEKRLIPACGHWTQQEKPYETNQGIIEFLKRRFGN